MGGGQLVDKSKIKSFGRAFSKARRVQRQRLWSLTAVSEILFCLTAREERGLGKVPPAWGNLPHFKIIYSFLVLFMRMLDFFDRLRPAEFSAGHF